MISHILYMTKQVLFYQTKKQCFEQTERWSNSSADEYIEAPSQSSQTLISCILNKTSNGWVLNLFGINKADTSPLQTKTSANLPAVGFNFSDGYRHKAILQILSAAERHSGFPGSTSSCMFGLVPTVQLKVISLLRKTRHACGILHRHCLPS